MPENTIKFSLFFVFATELGETKHPIIVAVDNSPNHSSVVFMPNH
jgi:hypothetical protein